jgi:hypothetical protein
LTEIPLKNFEVQPTNIREIKGHDDGLDVAPPTVISAREQAEFLESPEGGAR